MGTVDMGLAVSVISVVMATGAVVMVLLYRRHIRQTFDTLDRMIDAAIEGRSCEETFDESRLSALGNKLARYLRASKTSAQNIAEERNKIKGLITDISHQTKTPIANILLYSELLYESPLDKESLESVSAIDRQARKLSFLITSLVQLSRLESGIIALHPQEGDVWEIVREICCQYGSWAEQKGLYLRACGDDGRSVCLARFDRKWTIEAIGNIVDNAIKYTRSGGITIAVRPYELFCCVEIADTGPGIAEEETAQVFSRFYRSPSVDQEEGAGVGLYLAREILTAEDGYIKVRSCPGEGTAFGVYLAR